MTLPAGHPLGQDPPRRLSLDERRRWLEARGAVLCAKGKPLTERDIEAAEWFMAWLADPGHVPMPGCERCERVASLDLEPDQVASCGEHSYVRRGTPLTEFTCASCGTPRAAPAALISPKGPVCRWCAGR
jgi:hypothetical protein